MNDSSDFIDKLEEEYKKMLTFEIKTFEEAIMFLNWYNDHANDCGWMIKYYGYGEHFTFWDAHSGGFTDFNVDAGTGINWKMMKEIIIESAQTAQEYMRKDGGYE